MVLSPGSDALWPSTVRPESCDGRPSVCDEDSRPWGVQRSGGYLTALPTKGTMDPSLLQAEEEVVTQPLPQPHNRVPDNGGHGPADLGASRAVVGERGRPSSWPTDQVHRDPADLMMNRAEIPFPTREVGRYISENDTAERDTVVFQ